MVHIGPCLLQHTCSRSGVLTGQNGPLHEAEQEAFRNLTVRHLQVASKQLKKDVDQLGCQCCAAARAQMPPLIPCI